MVSPRMRPRFELRVPFSATEALLRVNSRLKESDCPCTGVSAGNHVHMNICRPHQRIWSPHLNLEVVPANEEGALIHGHFGPRQDIWSLFMALYAIGGFVALMGLMIAASQWSLGMPANALWLVVGGGILAGLVYTLALIGQMLSQEQMAMLLQFVRESQQAAEVDVRAY